MASGICLIKATLSMALSETGLPALPLEKNTTAYPVLAYRDFFGVSTFAINSELTNPIFSAVLMHLTCYSNFCSQTVFFLFLITD